MPNCERCGAEIEYPHTEVVRLSGAYYACLCTDCRNQFSKMCNDNPLFTEYQVLTIQIEKCNDHLAVRALVEAHAEVNRKIHNFSKLFVEGYKRENSN